MLRQAFPIVSKMRLGGRGSEKGKKFKDQKFGTKAVPTYGTQNQKLRYRLAKKRKGHKNFFKGTQKKATYLV